MSHNCVILLQTGCNDANSVSCPPESKFSAVTIAHKCGGSMAAGLAAASHCVQVLPLVEPF
jgi:hypothetical protein